MNSMVNDSTVISLVVTAMDTVKVFRKLGKANPHFYLAAQIPTHPGLIRDVSWANGSIRGFDFIATGCKDGKIRVYALHTSRTDNNSNNNDSDPDLANSSSTQVQSLGTPQSGITTAIAGRSNVAPTRDPLANASGLSHTVTEVACLHSGHWEVWQVKFSFEGDCLLSTGDDGSVRLWKQATNGKWLEFADIEVDDGEDQNDEGGESGE